MLDFVFLRWNFCWFVEYFWATKSQTVVMTLQFFFLLIFSKCHSCNCNSFVLRNHLATNEACRRHRYLWLNGAPASRCRRPNSYKRFLFYYFVLRRFHLLSDQLNCISAQRNSTQSVHNNMYIIQPERVKKKIIRTHSIFEIK